MLCVCPLPWLPQVAYASKQEVGQFCDQSAASLISMLVVCPLAWLLQVADASKLEVGQIYVMRWKDVGGQFVDSL